MFVLVPLYVRDVLGRGPEWYGFLLAASGGGALGGSAIGGILLPRISRPSTVIIGSVAGVAASVLALAAAREPWTASLAFVAIGTLSSFINIIVITHFQSAAPTEVRGRVMAVVITLSTAAVPVGMGLGGLFGDVWRDSLPRVFAGCGIALAAIAGIAWRWSTTAAIAG